MELDLFNNEDLVSFYYDLFIELSSDINADVLLKGNILSKLLPKDAKMTTDLDVTVLSKEVYETIVTPRLKEIAESICFGKDYTYEILSIDERQSGGLVIINISGITVYSIDISLIRDYGTVFSYKYSFDGVDVKGHSVEKIICDKCATTLATSRNRRMKDFYDLYILLANNIEYDLGTVFDLLLERVGSGKELKELLYNFPIKVRTLNRLEELWKVDDVSKTNNKLLKNLSFSKVYYTVSMIYTDLQDEFESRKLCDFDGI